MLIGLLSAEAVLTLALAPVIVLAAGLHTVAGRLSGPRAGRLGRRSGRSRRTVGENGDG